MNERQVTGTSSASSDKKAGKNKSQVKGQLEARIYIKVVEDIVDARQKGRALAQDLEFTLTQATLVATAISELARNIVLYAKSGEITLYKLDKGASNVGIKIQATDKGPGIPNIDHALMSGFSTSGGLGLGLPGVKEMVDEFEINSGPGDGTSVSIVMWHQ